MLYNFIVIKYNDQRNLLYHIKAMKWRISEKTLLKGENYNEKNIYGFSGGYYVFNGLFCFYGLRRRHL